jgi:hypothetical protein
VSGRPFGELESNLMDWNGPPEPYLVNPELVQS